MLPGTAMIVGSKEMLKKVEPRWVTVNVGFDGTERDVAVHVRRRRRRCCLFILPRVSFVVSSMMAGLVDKPTDV